MQLGKNVDKVMKNKNVMYVLLVVSILNVLNYLANKQFESTIFFCAVGFLTAYFSKNMSVVMSAAILGTLVFRQSNVSREGLEDNGDEKENGEEGKDEKKEEEVCYDPNNDNTISITKSQVECEKAGHTWGVVPEKKDEADEKDAGEKEEFTTGSVNEKQGSNGGNPDLAQAENLLGRLEKMMGKMESFGGMFGGKRSLFVRRCRVD